MMYEMTISRPQNYGEGLRNLPRGLSTKSLGLLLGYFKVIRLAYGLPWGGEIRKKESGNKFHSATSSRQFVMAWV